jgi:hypothetical protein
LRRARVDDVHRRVAGDGRDLGHLAREVGREIRLRQDHDGRGSALARHEQIPFEPARAEIGVEPHDHEDHVDVGGHHLLVGDLTGHLPREAAPPRQHRHDVAVSGLATLAHDDPVADRRELGPARGVVLQPSGGGHLQLAVLDIHPVDVVELDRHAPRTAVAPSAPLVEVAREVVAPAQVAQWHRFIIRVLQEPAQDRRCPSISP